MMTSYKAEQTWPDTRTVRHILKAAQSVHVQTVIPWLQVKQKLF